mmetsp:Transcript_62644/g.139805  ORF Transcript_62644/g.139805 Transcript_62644/m.139805 type:complete len:401 (-) Transcript_62644:246-1448(-)
MSSSDCDLARLWNSSKLHAGVGIRVHADSQKTGQMHTVGTAWAAAQDASESAVLVTCAGILQNTHWLGRGAFGHVAWASASVALGSAQAAPSTLHLCLSLITLARWFLVVACGRSRRRRRRWRRWRRWRWRWARLAGHDGVRSLALDATLAGACLATLQLHVTLLAPACTPTVLHEPVVLTAFRAVADYQDAMVQLGATRLAEDAALVELEGHLVCLDCHGHRLLGHSIHQRLLVVGLHVLVAGDAMCWDAHRAAGSFANAVLGGVLVTLLRAHRGLLFVLEAVVHEASTAALVAEVLRAIDQLLLRQGDQLAGGNGPCTLKGTSRAKCPTRTTLLLIFDRCHSVLAPPIHRTGKRSVARLVRAKAWEATPHRLWNLHAKLVHLELVQGHVRELIQAKRV